MQKREIDVHMLLTEEELQLLDNKMQEIGVNSRSAYLRKMALNGYCIHLEIPQVKEMIRLLRKCSDNLNQYAKRANATGNIYAEDIQDLQRQLNDIWEVAKKTLVSLSEIQ